MAWPNASAPGIAPTYYVDGIGFNGTPLLLSTSNSAVVEGANSRYANGIE